MIMTPALHATVRSMENSPVGRSALRHARRWRRRRDGLRPRVLCVGYLKTGTTSFGAAMRQLGFSHYGYDLDLQRSFQAGDLLRCLKFAEHFDSLDDRPWSSPAFVAAFQDRFPGSYYVLLERDESAWLKSYCAYFRPQLSDAELLTRLRHHNQAIRRLLADEPHVLCMNICAGDGYERLCPFLGIADPGVPFPWSNRGLN